MGKAFFISAIIGISTLVSGCVTTAPNGKIELPFLSTDGEKTPVDTTPIVIKVPGDSNIIVSRDQKVIGDLAIPNMSATHIPGASYSRIFIEKKTEQDFVVHVRNDNGVAGSGVKYTVGYKIDRNANGAYTVTLQPQYKSQYQQGLIWKFPVPNFTGSALREYLKTFTLVYKFEVNSQYNSDAVMANFLRLAKVKRNSSASPDPVTGKIYSQIFQTQYKDKVANYTVQTYPYRSGSKAVIHMELPARETSANEIDFQNIINDLKVELESIANS